MNRPAQFCRANPSLTWWATTAAESAYVSTTWMAPPSGEMYHSYCSVPGWLLAPATISSISALNVSSLPSLTASSFTQDTRSFIVSPSLLSPAPVQGRSHGGHGLLRPGRASQHVRHAHCGHRAAHRSDQVDPPGGEVSEREIGPKAPGGVHRRAVEGSAHRAPGHDVGTDRQRHEGAVELRPVGEVEHHEHQAERDDRFEAGGLPGLPPRGRRGRQIARHTEEG